ncbi:ABC transporter permease [Ureibacillus chungkukjangi]|uniref:Peptide/nickel transport system permease protein n=1 Tax=Ureibacillus chungkukjangi TaxID=1202712 RepID=A0A318TQU5_9BACL|nr:ABC transporter permease [Ureibacillus chungkukjangi]MCM3390115.1 ABC transporter permease [Ureibacillus chungkukjangi]PYF06307.1 peptide/nickel transport system permease protein [Ureibacillus chungkukjangi]
MTQSINIYKPKISSIFSSSYLKVTNRGKFYKILLFILGLPVHIVTVLTFYFGKGQNQYGNAYKSCEEQLVSKGLLGSWRKQFLEQENTKATFFHETLTAEQLNKKADLLVQEKLQKEIERQVAAQGLEKYTYQSYFKQLLNSRNFLLISVIPGVLMYVLLLLYSNPFVQFIFERVLQTLFVILGVATLVFTILYISPLDPARNILGIEATSEQIENFNRLYGLDQPYLAQLWQSLSGLFTFDLGTSFAGKEDIMASIANKFPVTLQIAILSLVMAVIIAIPVGILSAIRPNSFLDYTFMIVALIGLSIPSFWQGLIFILTFSLELSWFPATYNPQNWLSLVLPVVVLGTTLCASIARMTRSSMLEVINEDYIITAKAKGLNERKVISKHAIRNAMIPIITVIGLLFGGMLGGASVTEKVFNISGIGSYIVDKQFIPDIPAILGGVVYIAITISIVNLVIDITYAFFDPRIRSKMKKEG